MPRLILLFFLNQCLVFAGRMPPQPAAGLLERIRSGAWTFPPAWRARLLLAVHLPEPLPLKARVSGGLLLVRASLPLLERDLTTDGDMQDLLKILKRERKRIRMHSGRKKRRD